MKKTIVWIILLTFSLTAGCATMNDREQTRAQGAGIGALAGAATGALLGALVGGRRGAAIGAAAGVALGVTAGAMYGDHVANKKEKYANEEDYLNACLASAQQVCNDTMAYNETLEADLASLNEEADRVLADYNKNKLKVDDFKKTKTQVENKLAEANKKLELAQTELKIQKEAIQRERGSIKASTSSLESEINRLDVAVSELETQTQALASINQKFSV